MAILFRLIKNPRVIVAIAVLAALVAVYQWISDIGRMDAQLEQKTAQNAAQALQIKSLQAANREMVAAMEDRAEAHQTRINEVTRKHVAVIDGQNAAIKACYADRETTRDQLQSLQAEKQKREQELQEYASRVRAAELGGDTASCVNRVIPDQLQPFAAQPGAG